MVFVKIDETIQNWINQNLDSKTKEQIKLNTNKNNTIQFSDLKKCISNKKKEKLDQLSNLITPKTLLFTLDNTLELEVPKNFFINFIKEINLPKETVQLRERLKRKKELREFKKLTGRKTPIEQAGTIVKEYEASVKFAMTFIFSLFSSAIAGYYFCKVILQWDESYSMISAAITCFLTIIMETTLFMIKAFKNDKIQMKRKRNLKRKEEKMYIQKTPVKPKHDFDLSKKVKQE